MNIKKILNKDYLTKKYSLIAISVILFFAVLTLFVFVFTTKSAKKSLIPNNLLKNTEQRETLKNNKNLIKRKLDGVLVEKGAENPPIIATVINNHVEARPTIGLSNAGLVFEAEVEGGITRFLTFYSGTESVGEIGSIRSIRPYFIDWVNEFDALFSFCGGSPDALVKVIKDKVKNLNEFHNGSYYWRDNSRLAPHNVYSSGEKLAKYFQKNEAGESDFSTWLFKDNLPKDMRPASSTISIHYRLRDFEVVWKYDRDNNGYVRYVDGNLHREKDGEFIFAKNVVIQEANAKVLDEKLRLEMEIIGTGSAIICVDGKCQDGKWKKENKDSRTNYFYPNDQEVEFNAGTTWVQVVRPEIKVEAN